MRSHRSVISNILENEGVLPSGEKLTPKSLISQITRFADAWVAEKVNNEEHTKEYVESVLEQQRRKIVLSILGLRDGGFNGLEIDSTNGKVGLILQQMRIAVGIAAEKWLTDNIPELPELGDENLKSVKERYLREYHDRVTAGLLKVAEKRADQDVNMILNTVGYDPDGILTLLKDYVKDEKVDVPEVTPSRQFDLKGIVGVARVGGVVTLDGNGRLTMASIDIPDKKVWFLVILTSAWEPSLHAAIVTDGAEWHPVEAELVERPSNIVIHGVGPAASVEHFLANNPYRISKSFRYKEERVFEVMNEADAKTIGAAITQYVRENQK